MEKRSNMTQEELELMERFWQGAFADQEEEQRLREKYATDSVWRNKADGVRLLMLGIQEAALEDRMEDFHQQATRPVKKISWLRWGIAACLAAAVSFGALLFFSRSPGEKLFAAYYKPDPGLPTLMGVSDHYEFEKAMVSYKTGDYQKALAGWRQLLSAQPGNDTLHFFIGSAHLAEGRADSAVASLNRVIAVPQSAFQSDASWYLALAWLKLNNRAEAIKALKQSRHAYCERLLQELTR